MSESSNICLSCGLCCDGTIIGFVQLNSEELPVIRNLMDIEEVDDKGLFFLPCNNYGCNGCSIYAKRPKQCGKFKCGVLTSIEKKELGFDSAIEVIHEVKQKKIAIEKQIETLPFVLQSKSFYFKTLELKKLLKKDTSEISLSQDILKLTTDLKEFDTLLSKSFGLSSK